MYGVIYWEKVYISNRRQKTLWTLPKIFTDSHGYICQYPRIEIADSVAYNLEKNKNVEARTISLESVSE